MSRKGDDIEKLINSSLDDIVKQTKKERRMRKGGFGGLKRNGFEGGAASTSAGGGRTVNRVSRGGFKGSPRRDREFGGGQAKADNYKVRVRKRRVRNVDSAFGNFNTRNNNNRNGSGNNGFGHSKRMDKDRVRSIKIVAKLDDVPAPTAQQKAGINNLEVIPSSISSQKSRRNRVFG